MKIVSCNCPGNRDFAAAIYVISLGYNLQDALIFLLSTGNDVGNLCGYVSSIVLDSKGQGCL